MVRADVAFRHAGLLDHRSLVTADAAPDAGRRFVERDPSRALSAAYTLFAVLFHTFFLSTVLSAVANLRATDRGPKRRGASTRATSKSWASRSSWCSAAYSRSW